MEKKVKVKFTLKNNSGVETFSWEAVGELSTYKKLASDMVDGIKWMQSKALKMKRTNL